MMQALTKLSSIALAVYLVATPAAAAEITHTRKADGSHVVTISGQIHHGDDKKFIEVTWGLFDDTVTVILNSPGGYLQEAVNIGRRIRSRKYETRVQNGAACNSACTLIWLAGTSRHLDPRARLGFHSAAIDSRPPYKRSEPGNAAEAAYMTELRVPQQVIDLQPKADPCCLNYVDRARAQTWGLLSDPPAKQLALPTPQAQQPVAPIPASPKLMPVLRPVTSPELVPQQQRPTAARPEITARIEPGAPQRLPAPGALPAAMVAQKVVLYEEDPAGPNGKRFVGSAIWRTETVTPAPGQPPELAIRADIEVPERKLAMTWSLRRNTDKALPASHTVEIMFKLPPDFSSGGISNVPGILMKLAEQFTRGVPLAGLAVKITPSFYLIGLSNIDADKERNLQLLKERDWIDIPIVYNNNRRAILAMEKGALGERVFADAFEVWKR